MNMSSLSPEDALTEIMCSKRMKGNSSSLHCRGIILSSALCGISCLREIESKEVADPPNRRRISSIQISEGPGFRNPAKDKASNGDIKSRENISSTLIAHTEL